MHAKSHLNCVGATRIRRARPLKVGALRCDAPARVQRAEQPGGAGELKPKAVTPSGMASWTALSRRSAGGAPTALSNRPSQTKSRSSQTPVKPLSNRPEIARVHYAARSCVCFMPIQSNPVKPGQTTFPRGSHGRTATALPFCTRAARTKSHQIAPLALKVVAVAPQPPRHHALKNLHSSLG